MGKIIVSKQDFLDVFFHELPDQVEVNCAVEFPLGSLGEDRHTTMQLHISRPFQSGEYGLVIGHFGFSFPAAPITVAKE